MNSKIKWVLLLVAAVLSMVAIKLLYDKLTENYGNEISLEGSVLNNEKTEKTSEKATEIVSETSTETEVATETVSETASEITDDTSETPEEEDDESNYPVIDVTVYDKDGNPFKLSDFKGEIMIVNFWASWCPPCKSEMPFFEKYAEEYKDKVRFLMVDLIGSRGETQEDAQKYIDENGFTFDVYFDTDGEASYNYQLNSIPATMIVSRDNNILYFHEGALNEEGLKYLIDTLINYDLEKYPVSE